MVKLIFWSIFVQSIFSFITFIILLYYSCCQSTEIQPVILWNDFHFCNKFSFPLFHTYPNIKWIEGMFPLKNKFARVYSNTSFPTKHSITVVAHDSCAEAWPFSACHKLVRSSAFCRCGTDFLEIWPRVDENLN